MMYPGGVASTLLTTSISGRSPLMTICAKAVYCASFGYCFNLARYGRWPGHNKCQKTTYNNIIIIMIINNNKDDDDNDRTLFLLPHSYTCRCAQRDALCCGARG